MRQKTLELINSSVHDAEAASVIALAVGEEITAIQAAAALALTHETDQYNTFIDGGNKFREGTRGGKFVIDKVLTATGFAGVENTDWANVRTMNAQYTYLDDGTTKVRMGIRSTKYVVDRTKTVTGFAGAENTDWENLQQLPA